MNPLDFNSYLAIVYSSFAAIKFAFFTSAYVAAIVSLLIAMGKFPAPWGGILGG